MDFRASADKILFGIKVRQLRLDRKMAAAELAERSGLSVSYLSEIEKGKKFPKQEKLAGLAAGLGTSPESLLSQDLPRQFAPLEELLRSNFLDELPLEAFGLDFSRVVEIIANAPARVGAFISTLVELGRNYSLNESSFFYGALRAYQELTNNYQEDIEEEVEVFLAANKLDDPGSLTVDELSGLLKVHFNIQVVEDGLAPYPELDELRAMYIPSKGQLLLNQHLSIIHKRFQVARELGFQLLNITDRAYTSSLIRADSFEQVLSHYRATYFAVAFLMKKSLFVADIGHFFSESSWMPNKFLGLLDQYQATPEMFFQRLSNILPAVFGIDQVFFLRMSYDDRLDSYFLDNELHLNRQFRSHSKGEGEHYCRRWLAMRALIQADRQGTGWQEGRVSASAQRSNYVLQGESYLCLSIARELFPERDKTRSITMGMRIDDKLRDTIQFLDSPDIKEWQVGSTCERCSLPDCGERASAPVILHRRLRRKRIEETVRQLLEE